MRERAARDLTSSTDQRPNVFVVGFPKCGTTALHEYLVTHPNVHMCFPKEPHFFIEDIWHRRIAETEADYLELFSGAAPEASVLLDSSALHIYSEEALRRIHEFNPQARLIVMLRRPRDMVVSLHRYLLRVFCECEEDFGEAWRMQADRRAGARLPRDCRAPWLLQYERMGRMGTHVRALLRVWPREQVKFIRSDAFVRAPLQTYKSILSFLELPYDGRTEFPRVNEGGQWRSRWLGKMMIDYWPIVSRTVARSKWLRGIRKTSIFLAIWRMSSEGGRTEPPPAAEHKELDGVFRGEVLMLAQSTGLDLSDWLQEE
jgi:hypothetical protein